MNLYFLTKTGWNFFDVTRAYGLSILVYSSSMDKNTILSDVGSYYIVRSEKEPDFKNFDELKGFIKENDEWKLPLITIQRSLKKEPVPRVREIRRKIIDFLNTKNIKDLLENYRRPNPPSAIGKGNFILYQPMDLAATKGVRDTVLLKKQYSEGDQIKVPIEDFTLSILGHLNATIKRFSDDGLICLVPTPLETKVYQLRKILGNLEENVKGSHKAGWFALVTIIAVNLVLEEIRVEGTRRGPKFGSLLYYVMAGTGNQWKPYTGGIFPLDIFYELVRTEEGRAVLDKWRLILERTAFVKGYENLAVALSEFIANPSLSNYERYIKLHLRNELDKDRIKFGSYEKRILKEVVNYVGV